METKVATEDMEFVPLNTLRISDRLLMLAIHTKPQLRLARPQLEDIVFMELPRSQVAQIWTSYSNVDQWL